MLCPDCVLDLSRFAACLTMRMSLNVLDVLGLMGLYRIYKERSYSDLDHDHADVKKSRDQDPKCPGQTRDIKDTGTYAIAKYAMSRRAISDDSSPPAPKWSRCELGASSAPFQSSYKLLEGVL